MVGGEPAFTGLSIGPRGPVKDNERGNVHRHATVLDAQLTRVQRAQPLQLDALAHRWGVRIRAWLLPVGR